MKPVRMICLGAGSRGMDAYAPYALACPERLRFVAVAEPIEHKREAFAARGTEFLYDSVTNQQFPILTKREIDVLRADFAFERWQAVDDDRDGVRFCTGWATKPEHVDALIAALRAL